MIQTGMYIATILVMCLVLYLGYKWGYDTAKKTLYDPTIVENEQLKDKCHILYRDYQSLSDEMKPVQCELDTTRSKNRQLISDEIGYRKRIADLETDNKTLTKQLTEFSEAAQQAKEQVMALMNKQNDDHEKELQCAGCYYREQLNRDRKDFMDIIAAKETMIQQLHKDLNRFKQMGNDKHEIGFAPAGKLSEGGSDEVK